MSKHASLIIALLLAVSGCGSPSDSRPDQRTEQKQVVPTEVQKKPVESDLTTPQLAVASVSPASALLADHIDRAISALDISNRPIRVLVPTKTFSTDHETGALKLTFEDLDLQKVLNMDPVTEDAVSWMPEWMKSLDGHMVRIRGYMYPTFDSEGIENFVLLWDNQVMNFGPAVKIYNHILVNMKSGITTNHVPLTKTLDVVGRFEIELLAEKRQIYQLFVIDDASVIVQR